MKVLVIGGGGREHALVWALGKSARVTEIVCAPGNGGIAGLARCVALDVASVSDTVALVEAERPGFVIVGPEVPLAAGAVDALQKRGVKVFGPMRAAAMLETSKAFAKRFMRRWEIPTAGYAVVEAGDDLRGALEKFGERVVLKVDGLAAGKGVVLCESHELAVEAAKAMFDGSLLGAKAESVVIEEMLEGPEVSFFAICDGTRAVGLAAAQDHKRIGEGDTGPNTGGMGAYSTDDLLANVRGPQRGLDFSVDREGQLTVDSLTRMAQRVVDGMRAEGAPFVGVLFIGLMMTADGPKVLEFNTRFGDPETEAIMLRLDCDLLEMCEAAVEGRIAEFAVRLKPGASACVIAASAGYPGKYVGGKVISGLGSVPADVVVFHSGTAAKDGEIVTAGGRVLAVTAAGADLAEALGKVYAALDGVRFEGMQFRRDIGWRALGG